LLIRSIAHLTLTRVLALRVDLRLPDTAATDAAVISRFTDARKPALLPFFSVNVARANASGRPRCVLSGYVNLAKSKEEALPHGAVTEPGYVVRTGDYNDPDTLAGMIKQAWCSALQVDAEAHAVLARFPKSPVSWLERGNPAQLQQALAQAAYLAKRETKVTDDGERNFGCSRG
jgi:hypothetical protein